MLSGIPSSSVPLSSALVVGVFEHAGVKIHALVQASVATVQVSEVPKR